MPERRDRPRLRAPLARLGVGFMRWHRLAIGQGPLPSLLHPHDLVVRQMRLAVLDPHPLDDAPEPHAREEDVAIAAAVERKAERIAHGTARARRAMGTAAAFRAFWCTALTG